MGTKLVYATRPCGRCGGSGNYSYCTMYGTTCFKCRGAKVVLTKPGATAAAAIREFIAANFSVKVRDLKPGDRVTVEGYGVVRTVTTVHFDGSYGSSNGVPYESWTVEFAKPVKSPFGTFSSMGMSGDTTMVKAVGGADWDTVVAFARTLKKGVTVVETPAPAAVDS